MADVKIDLNWDVVDGQLQTYLTINGVNDEIATVTLDHDEIIEAFAEDFHEADRMDDPNTLFEWEDMAENMAEISTTILTAIEALRAKTNARRETLLTEGVKW